MILHRLVWILVVGIGALIIFWPETGQAADVRPIPGATDLLGWLTWIVAFLLDLLAAVFRFFLWLAGIVFYYALTIETFIRARPVTVGWPFVLGIANLGFLLALLFIAATLVLRLNFAGGVRRLLPRLLIAALLINFSLVIGAIIIDFSRLATAVIYRTVAGGDIADVSTEILSNSQLVNTVWDVKEYDPLKGSFLATPATGKDAVSVSVGNDPGKALTVVVKMFMGLAMMAFLTVALGFLAALFFIRWIMLMLLLVASPLAYLALAIPGADYWQKKWWNSFLKWTLLGPAAMMILALAIRAGNTVSVGKTDPVLSDFLLDALFTSTMLIFAAWGGKKLGELGGQAGSLAAKATGKTLRAGWGGTRFLGGQAARVPYLGAPLRGAQQVGESARRQTVGRVQRWLARGQGAAEERKRLREQEVGRAKEAGALSTRERFGRRYATPEGRDQIDTQNKALKEVKQMAGKSELDTQLAVSGKQGPFTVAAMGVSRIAAAYSPGQFQAIGDTADKLQLGAIGSAIQNMPTAMARTLDKAQLKAMVDSAETAATRSTADGGPDFSILRGIVSNPNILNKMDVQQTTAIQNRLETMANNTTPPPPPIFTDNMTDAERDNLKRQYNDDQQKFQRDLATSKELLSAFNNSVRQSYGEGKA